MLKQINRYLFREYIEWAENSKPLLNYEISRNAPENSNKARFGRISGWIALLSVMIIGGYFFATNGLQNDLVRPYSLALWQILIIPLFLMQLILRIAALSLGVNAVSQERRRQTWDNLRATERGTEISLQTRFPAIFSQLNGLVVFIMLGRILLLGAILYEVMSIEGDLLGILATRSNPSLSLEMGVILLGAFMTAFVLLPITATSVDIAIGLLISSVIRNRAFAAIAQSLVIGFRVVTSLLLFWWGWNFFTGSMSLEPNAALGLLGSSAVLGDWGLLLSQFTHAGELWRTVPYSIFIGIFLLVMLILQVVFAQLLTKLAVRAAETKE